MGEKDETERTLMAFNDVFADIMNVFLFGGERVIDPADLEDVLARETYVADGKVRGLDRDVAKRWISGSFRIACLGLENQTGIDSDMALRIMGYEGSEYRSQLFKENESKPRYPVVSVVLYLGYDRRWSGSKTLREALKLDEDNVLTPYVTDLKLNLFEVAWLEEEQVDLFQSDFRVVADYLVKRRKYGNEYVPSPQELDHVEAVVELLGAMTGDSRYKDALEEAWARGREVTTLDTLFSSVLEKGEARGEARGRAERERELVLSLLEDGMPVARVARVSKLTEEEVLDIARGGDTPS